MMRKAKRDADIFYHDLIAEDDPDLLEEEIEDIMAIDRYMPNTDSDYVIKIVMSESETETKS